MTTKPAIETLVTKYAKRCVSIVNGCFSDSKAEAMTRAELLKFLAEYDSLTIETEASENAPGNANG